jgi:hypothetical protein
MKEDEWTPLPIKSALTDLEKDLALARDARYQIECERANRRPRPHCRRS